jgi:hypothetical protein
VGDSVVCVGEVQTEYCYNNLFVGVPKCIDIFREVSKGAYNKTFRLNPHLCRRKQLVVLGSFNYPLNDYSL